MAAAEQHYSMPRGSVDKPTRVLIVVAPYYRDIADQMIAGAQAEITAWGATHELIEVPGALEVPTAIAMAGRMSNYDAYVALGCVIRGETTHYDTVCNDSSRGLTLLGLQGLCIGNGILTVENRDQALVRARTDDQNKGGGAAAAALHLLALSRKWGAPKSGVGFRPATEEYRLAGGETSV
ncbi:6,7-dimethyl-8-ribityllumazine synthase [Pseudooceanicola sediminis]|uniref:6,7-dimethyl-8-ribityllumazine synthase n=1 Tax=Pseudooceanicola sediminis TaxID=2211117 RepID=A0A399J5I7_9RHOB|nr:6,7-dimethyl-8-ribityllumazine synthase [Pseudooceanicola sediminis]KAA2316309.1 6,7-dimethyl-8-ribityllumazine synthase [Puniceibacterium sp. HSS470]RII39222.1 6,7-dimethyl-8-ribityllumazine synthase [Pseudooceanicola sediminis]|tara:strand:+ start:14130 stop:14672 length:543 start_codon:yes stop_codon:yes gene_type:complete